MDNRQAKHSKGPTKTVSSSVNLPEHPHNFFDNKRLHYSILIILTFVLYGWTYDFDYSLSDPYILSAINSIPNTLHGLSMIFKQAFAGTDYRPVSIFSFWLERFLTGEITPHFSHLINVFLYSLINIKLYDFILVCNFYGVQKDAFRKSTALALFASILFLVHTNHVGVVANIKSRDNLLSMLFGLLAAIQAISAYDSKKIYKIGVSLFFIILALLSKSDSYAFIFISVMVVLMFRDVNKKKLLRLFILLIFVFIISSTIINILTPDAVKQSYGIKMTLDKNPLVGNDSFINRLSLSITTLFYYLKFLFIPWGYHFIFGYNQIPLTDLFAFLNVATVISMLMLLALCIRYYQSNKLYLFCLVTYSLSIAYALNLFLVVSNILMDRYNFIPSLSFCIALAALLMDIYKTYSYSILTKAAPLIIILVFTGFTYYRTADWKNLFTLTEHDMPYLKNSYNAHRIAGAAYINATLQAEMEPDFHKKSADSMLEIGEQYIDQALKIYDGEVQSWEAKGLCHFYRKDYTNALSCFIKCKTLDSTYLSGINYVGFTYLKLNKIDSAYFYFSYVMAREHAFGYAANNMINMLIDNNRKQEADSIIRDLYNKYPDDVWLNHRISELYGSNQYFK